MTSYRTNNMANLIDTYIDLQNLTDLLLYKPNNPLLFNTGLFLILFLGFLFVYQLLRRFKYLKMIFVILFSLYFYYKSSAECCFILLGVAISDYILGNLLSKTKTTIWRKTIVAFNVMTNVGMLIYFKYFQLLVNTLAEFSAKEFDSLDIILPAGISFFTFRSISYIVDIYRGNMNAVKNPIEYIFCLTFFPPLLAGPVVRAKDLIPQIQANAQATRSMVSEGFYLIMCGLFKKIVIADYICNNFVDRIFDNPSLYSGFENLMGAYGFTLQLYCDFSGYSDMAIGIALLLGYRFLDNFNSPFKSQNPTEFWRRWHISLSSWLRDYLYIPMGGSRVSRFRSRLNLLNTMVLGGLWHGASWMFLIWGAWNGLLLIAHKEIKKIMPKIFSGVALWKRPINIFITFNLIAFGMIFFRAESMTQVGEMLTQISTSFHASVIPQFVNGYTMIVVAMLVGFCLHFLPHSLTIKSQKLFNRCPLLIQGLFLALMIFIVIQVRQSDIVPFIYLQY